MLYLHDDTDHTTPVLCNVKLTRKNMFMKAGAQLRQYRWDRIYVTWSEDQRPGETEGVSQTHSASTWHRTTTSWHVVHGINLFIMNSTGRLSDDEEKVINHLYY